MILKNTLLFFILLTPLICYGENFSPEFVKHVFLNLDITSFENSLRQLHATKGTRMKDSLKYMGRHIIRECQNKNCTEIFIPDNKNKTNYNYNDSGWFYKLRILSVDKNKITACFIDYCGSSDCSFNVVQPLEIEEKKGKYIVIHSYKKNIKGCKFYIDGNS